MFTSVLLRAKRTAKLILKQMDQTGLKTIENQALNERDYGDLSGLNKDEAREKWGKDQVHAWRRSFNTPPPWWGKSKEYCRQSTPLLYKQHNSSNKR